MKKSSLAALLTASAAGAQTYYKIRDLGTLPGLASSLASDTNRFGYRRHAARGWQLRAFSNSAGQDIR